MKLMLQIAPEIRRALPRSGRKGRGLEAIIGRR